MKGNAWELYFPAWFADVAKAKAPDTIGLSAGTTEWVRPRQAKLGVPGCGTWAIRVAIDLR